jgi:hypothetical protein
MKEGSAIKESTPKNSMLKDKVQKREIMIDSTKQN